MSMDKSLKEVLSAALATVVTSALLVMVWEFSIEPFLPGSEESEGEKWRFVMVAMGAVLVGIVYPCYRFLKSSRQQIITQAQLKKSRAELEARVKQRTSDLAATSDELAREAARHKQTAQLLKRMMDSIDEVFWVSDADGRTMRYVSPAYQKVWGKSCDSLFNDPMGFVNTIHPEDSSQRRSLL